MLELWTMIGGILELYWMVVDQVVFMVRFSFRAALAVVVVHWSWWWIWK